MEEMFGNQGNTAVKDTYGRTSINKPVTDCQRVQSDSLWGAMAKDKIYIYENG